MTVAPEALALLREWLPGNEDPDRPRMQLATLDETGAPDVRTVLLSEWDETGLYLHTDANSRKVAQLTASPAVALDLLWPGFARQLVVQGTAERADPDEERSAYARRSPYLRQLAWQNTHELARAPREERERVWAEFQAEHDIGGLEPPATWIGYRVRPTRLTFWEANPAGPSHRVEFALAGGTWTRSDLPG
ncbi:pyridoxine/pyridoxamine 5'-phosphate oxidase [Naasia aerilata]|uniref:Pyridoxine/pyridoxamine 5'-phosphate oxidase n=1 Tax=Naasia aerilata TaxID=1162966 RepID=A0ABM8GBQ7_9MICO|nr:pyridoxamine 5'-phosphate oxidase family protein [Naasia aerilata]BDZ45669.1 pyridoxine/pyridoxamine 5'-phosphate oxidase [Naasia aerilata]